jgi:hypothetical protein
MLKGSNYRLLRDEDPWTPRSVERFVAWNLAKKLPDVFAPEIPAREPGALRRFVASALGEAGGGSLFQRLDYFYLVRYRRWAGGVKCIYRRYFPVREPFVSYRLLEYLFSADPAVKAAHLPHFEILERNYPAIRLDLTNKMSPALPLNLRTWPRFLPSLAWRGKQLIRGFSRRFLPREIFPLVDYVDYRRWIREPSGRALVQEVLDPPRMASISLYDGERLEAWLSGEPAFPVLDRMVTLELFFREVLRP